MTNLSSLRPGGSLEAQSPAWGFSEPPRADPGAACAPPAGKRRGCLLLPGPKRVPSLTAPTSRQPPQGERGCPDLSLSPSQILPSPGGGEPSFPLRFTLSQSRCCPGHPLGTPSSSLPPSPDLQPRRSEPEGQPGASQPLFYLKPRCLGSTPRTGLRWAGCGLAQPPSRSPGLSYSEDVTVFSGLIKIQSTRRGSWALVGLLFFGENPRRALRCCS